VTTHSPSTLSPSAQFSAFLSRFPAETIALVKRCLPKIRQAVRCTHEVVYDYGRQIVVSMGMSERGYEAIVSVAIQPDALRLYFSRDLPDPDGLLQGTGSKVRFVTIASAADLDRPAIQALFKAATARHAHAATGSRAGVANRSIEMIIKSASKKKTTTNATKKKKRLNKPMRNLGPAAAGASVQSPP